MNCVFWFSLQFCLKYFSLWKEFSGILSSIYWFHHVKYPLILSDCNECLISRQFFFFEEYSNIKFHVNPCSGSLDVPCGQTGKHDVPNSRFNAILRKAPFKRLNGRYVPAIRDDKRYSFKAWQANILPTSVQSSRRTYTIFRILEECIKISALFLF